MRRTPSEDERLADQIEAKNRKKSKTTRLANLNGKQNGARDLEGQKTIFTPESKLISIFRMEQKRK